MLAGIGFILWWMYIILTYYSTSYSPINHIESIWAWYWSYLLSIWILYWLYKVYTLLISPRKEISFNAINIFGLFLLQITVLATIFTGFVWNLMGWMSASSLVLIWKILGFLFYPLFLIILWRSIWYSLVSLIWKEWKIKITPRIRIPAEISIWMFIFSTGLMLLGGFGYYTTIGIWSIIILFSLLGAKWFIETYTDIRSLSIRFDNHQKNIGLINLINPKLLSAEFSFIMVTFLIWVSLISIIRPMPIGWDDLWVYMNFPKMLALSWNLIEWAWMYTWQLITGTGFLFSSIFGQAHLAAQAFYVNQIGGILAVIFITSTLSYVFQIKDKKILLSLPIIFATIFYAMPMNIFQQAKDMKLDPALLSVSISWLALLFVWWREELKKNDMLKIYAISGIIIGLAFSIKFTSLMLILWVLWLIAYRTLSIYWFYSFFFLFLAIFTKFWLLTQLNVWMPTDSVLISKISTGLILVAWISLLLWIYKKGIESWKDWIVSSIIFVTWVLIGISPWIVKNTLEVNPIQASKNTPIQQLVLSSVLNWSGWTLNTNYSTIFSEEEYKERSSRVTGNWITGSGQSQNEDLWRYFGYDKWINNYLKLPPNLTFQKNQPGEFTDITYIFLAFIPIIFLFIRWRKNYFPIAAWVLSIILFWYYFTNSWSKILGNIFAVENLLWWYLVLIIINISIVWFSHFTLDESIDENKKIKELIVFLGIYWFLFAVSAFGIVWYGIVIYYVFFALIGLAGISFIAYKEEDRKDEDTFWLKVTLTVIFSIFIAIYFLRSSFPHWWNNLREAVWYSEFKYWLLTQEEAIFGYRQDYTNSIAAMNIKDTTILIQKAKEKAKTETLRNLFASEKFEWISVRDFTSVLFSLQSTKDKAVQNDAKQVADFIYKSVLYPREYAKELVNTGGIYRIGTFMTYLINQNRERYLDDSLIFLFDTFFYDKDPSVTAERMKKMWIKYLLVDLNAATIDKDPRRALTNRFEELLLTMKSTKLNLVDTDNICLRLAIDEYQQWILKTDEEFINIAWTNYESYKTISWSVVQIGRGQKQMNCYNYILKKFATTPDTTLYSYLMPIREAIATSWADKDQSKLWQIFSQYAWQSWFALFEIK